MSISSGAVSVSAPPTACAIRPQFGSPPLSAALTSAAFATPRASRSTATPSVPLPPPPRAAARAPPGAAGAPRALAVADDLEPELAQQRVERRAEREPGRGLRL